MSAFSDGETVKYAGGNGAIVVGSGGLIPETSGAVAPAVPSIPVSGPLTFSPDNTIDFGSPDVGQTPLRPRYMFTRKIIAAANDLPGSVAAVNTELLANMFTGGGNIVAYSSGASPALFVMRFNGTGAAPTALANTNIIGSFVARGYDGTAFSSTNYVRFIADEAWVVGAHGTRTDFYVTPVTTTTPIAALILRNAGGVEVQTNGAAGVTSGLCLINQVSGAAGNVGTLGNAPAVGNPTFWLPVNINGVLKYVPAW
jgi:hypothetical protein